MSSFHKAFTLVLLASLCASVERLASEPETRYLAFQLFTGVRDSEALRAAFPPPAQDTAAAVGEIVRVVGGVGDKNRKLAFVVGPLSFDHTDDQIRSLIRDSFSLAIENNIAVGFHIDDSMFWGRLIHLHTPETVEWLNWTGTPNTGRRVDWSSTPLQVMPQLCVNSPAVEAEVVQRARLIAEAVTQGIAALDAAEKPELFAGVIAGWETQIGRDFSTGSHLGYCALTNKGYGAERPPSDMNEARADVTREFVDLWTRALADAGVPETKIFSHTAFIARALFDSAAVSQSARYPATYLEAVNFAPPRVAFGARRYAGFSTYPQLGGLEQIRTERATNGNPPWASVEGAAIDPGGANRERAGESMEAYLGDLFNHGAVLVNIFGWGVGNANDPFRRAAENGSALAAYQKFLRGETLRENAQAQVPSSEFFVKVGRLQNELPRYFNRNGRGDVGSLYDTLRSQLDAQRFTDAEATIDAILKIIEK